MIEMVFEQLRATGMVSSGNEFSREWLGMDESYMRSLRAKKRLPSPKALARCALRLKHHGDVLADSKMGAVQERAQQLHLLADRCIRGIFEVSGGRK